MLIIADTSCLIVLEKIGRLELLKELFEVITITPEVKAEYGQGLPDWVQLQPVVDTIRQQILARDLDKGEASAIALAVEHADSLLLIDERKGRNIALELGINITGTLGVLIRGKQQEKINSLATEIDKLRKVSFRMSEALILRILDTYESD